MVTVLAVILSLFNAFSGASNNRDDHWYCFSIGHSDKNDEMLLSMSDIFYNEDVSYDSMVSDFKTKVSEQTNNDFVFDSHPKCVDFSDNKEAEHNRDIHKKIAVESKFKIIDIEFYY